MVRQSLLALSHEPPAVPPQSRTPNAKPQVITSGSALLRFVFVFPTETFQEIQYHFYE